MYTLILILIVGTLFGKVPLRLLLWFSLLQMSPAKRFAGEVVFE